MSDALELSAKPRQGTGTRACRRLRDAGEMPGVIYGHKQETVPIAVPAKELLNAIEHGHHLFTLKFDDKTESVLLKDAQYDHLGTDLVHVDFFRVDPDEVVEVTIPLHFKGEAPGEKDGGTMQTNLSEVQVKCRVSDIPDELVVDISHMKINDAIHVGELKLLDGMTATHEPTVVVCMVHPPRTQAQLDADTAETTEAEPEVIGKENEDGAGEGEDK